MAHKSPGGGPGRGPLASHAGCLCYRLFLPPHFLAPYWMFFIALLIICLSVVDILGHGITTHRRYPSGHRPGWRLPALLLVPGILVAVLTTAENSGHWLLCHNGFRLHRTLAWHWLFRSSHILGASLVVGATFHYSSPPNWIRGRAASCLDLRRGLVAGPPLSASVHFFIGETDPSSRRSGRRVMGRGPAALGDFRAVRRGASRTWKTIIPLLMLVLVAMLLTRQLAAK